MDKLTLHQLLTNPSGPGAGYLAARYQIIDNLNRRFIELASIKPFRHYVYYGKSETVFHVKVPTENEKRDFFWDVVIEVYNDKVSAKALLESEVKVFSNSPSFAFFYGYVADKSGLLIPWLKNKLPSAIYIKPPDVRNPIQQMGFEKTIYYACQWILTRRLYDPEVEAQLPLKKAELTRNIETFNSITTKYDLLKKQEAKERKFEKERNRLAESREKKLLKEGKDKVTARALEKTSTHVKSAKKAKSVKKAKKV